VRYVDPVNRPRGAHFLKVELWKNQEDGTSGDHKADLSQRQAEASILSRSRKAIAIDAGAGSHCFFGRFDHKLSSLSQSSELTLKMVVHSRSGVAQEKVTMQETFLEVVEHRGKLVDSG
jgi:hypothetical protein